VRLLFDSHAALWLLLKRERLSPRAVDLLGDPANELLLSSVVVWEVLMKQSLGKLDAPDDFVEQMLSGGAVPLPLTIEHAEMAADLPWHHRDPFDRMLVAQATAEGATLLSADPALRAYHVNVTW
jgi:PIN domain nuclease of toxin-antitoxin system